MNLDSMTNIIFRCKWFDIQTGYNKYENKCHSIFPQFYHNRVCEWFDIYGIKFRRKYFFITINHV